MKRLVLAVAVLALTMSFPVAAMAEAPDQGFNLGCDSSGCYWTCVDPNTGAEIPGCQIVPSTIPGVEQYYTSDTSAQPADTTDYINYNVADTYTPAGD